MTTSTRKPIHWVLEDHLHANCGGRLLRSVANQGMSPGGNPIIKCSKCNFSTWGHLREQCWCTVFSRAYRCVPTSELVDKPYLKEAMRECGIDPDDKTVEIGIVLRASERRLEEQAEANGGALKPVEKIAEDFFSHTAVGNKDYLVSRLTELLKAVRKGTV